MALLRLSLLLAVAAAAKAAQPAEKSAVPSPLKIVCYYSNWAVYRPSLAKFTPQNINPYLCTHIIYAFAGFNKRYELKPYDPYNDIEQGNYKKFVGLKQYNPGLKTMVAVGGWNEGSKRFSHMVSERSQRQKFVRSAVKFCREHDFDGIDMDWEYPSFRDGGKPEDKQGYALLIKELREAFEAEPVPPGKQKLVLSVAVPAGKEYIDGGFDVKSIAKSADFLNLLTYDYHTAYEASTQHHAPLAPRADLEEWDEENRLNVRWTVDYYLRQGAPRSKLVVGLPTYGRSYTLADPEDIELDAAAEGPGEPGNSTREKGYLAYYEICQNVNEQGWELERPHPALMGPYAFKDGQWVGFDDEEIIRQKAKFILRENLGGAMIWTLDNDDFRGNCGGEQSPLITALRKELLASSASSKGVLRPAQSGTVQQRKALVADEYDDDDEQTTTTTTVAPPRRTVHRRKKGRSPNRQPNQSSLRPGGNLALSITTPAPPPTPDPGPAFECEDEGFFNNPRDCRKYFWCLDSGPANLGIVAHAFTCPSGLYFNSKSEACDYKENVVCRTPLPVEPTSTTTKKPRRSKARSTTTTTPEPEVVTEKKEEDVAELLRLLKSIGGVEKLQTILTGNEPAPLSEQSGTRAPGVRRPVQDALPDIGPDHQPLGAAGNVTETQGQQIRRPQFQQEPQLFQYVEPARPAPRPLDSPQTNVFVAPINGENQQSPNPFQFVYQTPERHQPPQGPPADLNQAFAPGPAVQPTVPPFVYQTPVRNQQPDVRYQLTTPPSYNVPQQYQPVPQQPVPSQQSHQPQTGQLAFTFAPGVDVQRGSYQTPGQQQRAVVHVPPSDGTVQRAVLPEAPVQPAIPVQVPPQAVPQQPRRVNKVVRITGPPGDVDDVPLQGRRGKRIRVRPAQAIGEEPSDTGANLSGQRRVAIRRRPVISPPSQEFLQEQSVQLPTTTTTTTSTTTTTTTTTPPPTTEPYFYEYEYVDEVTEPPTQRPRFRPTTTTTTTTTTTKRPPRRRPVHRRPAVAPDRFAPPLIVIDEQTVDCNKRGVFAHPTNCGKFVVCAPNSREASGLRGYVHHCPAEQVYLERKGRCMKGDRDKCH